MNPTLPDKVDALPTGPGVYLFMGEQGEVLYVGKAKDLRARVRQYIRGQDERLHVRFLAAAAADVEVVATRTEKEALLLERTLIRKHGPPYNVLLVDDTNFLHLHVDPAAPWPRYRLVRRITKSKGRFFGPFASASRARATLQFMERRFPLRTCSDRELASRTRPCLLHQMGRCMAPCVDLCAPEDYRAALDESLLFLEGRNTELMRRLRARMKAAATAKGFEEAARLRDLIGAIEASMERQDVVDGKLGNRDIWGLTRQGNQGVVAILSVRGGHLEQGVTHAFGEALEGDAELLSSLLNTFYGEAVDIPPEVLLPFPIPELELLGEILSEARGGRVRIAVPKRGHKARLVKMAARNASVSLTARAQEGEARMAALERIAQVCGLSAPPMRIECFDNSNIQGADPVASMVVFSRGVHDRAASRRYRVKTVVGSDDFASMREILHRRLTRGMAEQDLPDLVVVDGGQGQLSAALGVRDALALPEVKMIGLAKFKTERARGELDATDKIILPGTDAPLRLDAHDPGLRLLQAIRDKAHSTAVTYHRKVRRARTLTSVLDDLPGVGPARRRALLRHFGSVAAMKHATKDELCVVEGVGPQMAARIHKALGTDGT
jgi:excinuclease ABC subunit C